MNILEFQNTPALAGTTFQGESWEAWRAVLSGAFAIPMDDDRLALFKELSGGREPPPERVREAWVIAGRRSAKTHTAGSVCVYLATIAAELDGLTDKLSPGETGVIALLATDRRQAKTALGYIHGLIDESPVLSRMVVARNTESIQLNNRVSIEVSTASYRAIRSRTLLACVLDEIAFFRDAELSIANDKEIYRAAVPGLATTGGMLIGISSPYAKRGLLHEKFRKHYGQDGDILVVKGSTPQFNPTIDRRVIDDALIDDPEAAKTEWLAEFRDGISTFVARETVEGCTRPRPLIIPRQPGVRYTAFADPAGGGVAPTADQFTLAIAHRDTTRVVVDGVWARRGSPAEIVAEYAEILAAYGVREIFSDRYAGQWPQQEFERHRVRLQYTEKNRSQLYTEFLPQLNTGGVELPPDPVLTNQLCSLERRPGRLQDIIDHPPGGHDDVANAVAGVSYHAKGNRELPHVKIRFVY